MDTQGSRMQHRSRLGAPGQPRLHRWEGMNRDPRRISLLAEILVEKHGFGAPAVARRRAHLWSDADELADFWRAVGEAAARRSLRPVTNRPCPRCSMVPWLA